MKMAVSDTHVMKKNEEKMHFDIIVPNDQPYEKTMKEIGYYIHEMEGCN
ncbi:MAG: DUF2024 family protein [Candidatus Brocadia sp.]|nr:DUF2024 family protein [Candidatus Brocadia sp.]